MIIFPSIDIRQGKCVRLYKGDYATTHQVYESPQAAAEQFRHDGASWIHVVDLDGAKDAVSQNRELVLEIARKTGLQIQVGGGIRTMRTLESYLNYGIKRVILGSAALKDRDFLTEALARYGERIVVGIDARERRVAAEGWTETTNIDCIDFAKIMEQLGTRVIVFTDIGRDGMLSGPNIELLEEMNMAVSCDIIASGGIKDIEDIKKLMQMGLYGAICGKSVYSGALSLKEAIDLTVKA